jgi:hypothetical protein
MKEFLTAIFSLLIITGLQGQQSGDDVYSPEIANPAFKAGEGPRVAVDAAHYNFHTADRRYRPFADVLRKDGFQVMSLKNEFSDTSLTGIDVLVISNALNASNIGNWQLPTPSAFTPDEMDAVVRWVESGGSLLLIADHMPFPGAAAELAGLFGFSFNNGFAFGERRGRPMIFKRSDETLRTHTITSGRNPSEQVDSVATFTGQGFQIAEEITPILVFGENSYSLVPEVAWQFSEETERIEIEGWCQGAVREFGKGRIAVFGEAAMFTAQVAGANRIKVGLNSAIAGQNLQFLLNTMHWLAESLMPDP